MTTTSALYEGWVSHERLGSPEHRFRARATLALLDLTELDDVVAATPLWSAGQGWPGRLAPVQVRRRDYLDGTDRPMASVLGDLVEGRLGRRPRGPMRVLTQPRRLGWLFNPLTVYWCDTPDGHPDVVVLEVTNTPWHERHWYVLDQASASGPFAKDFHVSPFLPMDLSYHLDLDAPPDAAAIHLALQARRNDEPVFEARLEVDRIELTAGHALASLARRPLATVGVSAGIRGQAVALAAKSARFHRHPHRQAHRGLAPTEPVPT